MRVLVTGVNGFIGTAIVTKLHEQDRYQVRTLGRASSSLIPGDYHSVDLSLSKDWTSFLTDVDVVVHCAARAHIMKDQSNDPLLSFREINTQATLDLAGQAADAGVKRFIFISSVKVNGERTFLNRSYNEKCQPIPEDPYGLSKFEAEQGLLAMARSTGMQVVIIRPPLVYGPGVKGNLLSLLKIARLGLPLPFGSIRNMRSMVYVGNLVDFIIKCIDHPAAANEIFLISDGRDTSTSELIRLIRQRMGMPSRLLPFPPVMLLFIARLVGKRAMMERLCGNLQVDSSNARKKIGWSAPFTVEDGISEMVCEFLKVQSQKQ